MTPSVLIELFGGLRLRSSKSPAVEFSRQQTGALLAWLALNIGRSHTREELMALIWPDDDPDSARHKLRQSLYALRRHLDSGRNPSEVCLTAMRDTVGLAPLRVITDVALFEDAIRNASTVSEIDARIDYLTQAVDLYRGELLPGFYQDEIAASLPRYCASLRTFKRFSTSSSAKSPPTRLGK
jgi:DNA-binding SARP family transcriptional activator